MYSAGRGGGFLLERKARRSTTNWLGFSSMRSAAVDPCSLAMTVQSLSMILHLARPVPRPFREFPIRVR